MATRSRPADEAREDARYLAGELGRELRIARRLGGLSIGEAAKRAAMSDSQLSRLELGRLTRPDFDQLARAGRAVGLRLSCRFYPTGEPVRDHAQLTILARFEHLLAPPLASRREVPLPIVGDLRAWDARITDGRRRSASVEVESKITDAQALQRRLEAKVRDDPEAGPVILVLNRTAHNRSVLAAHREAFRALLPLDGGSIIRCLRRGEAPTLGGIVLL
jgi:transcriptional regulator with XRE-family HTH domain